MSWYHIIWTERRTKSWTVSFSEDALATLSTERQQASTSYWGEHPLPLTKRTGIQVQGLWPKFPFVCLPLHQGLVFPGWRWDLFCTRNDCAAQLQRRKPCQVSFGRFAWNRIWGFYSDSGHRVNVYCWEIGLLSAATAHAAVPPAIGQVSLSE